MKERQVGNASARREGVGVFGSALEMRGGQRVRGCIRRELARDGARGFGFGIGCLLRPVLLAGQDGKQRWFGGRRDLDYSVPRVRWLRTPLRGKAEAQRTRPSKPEKKGTRPIGNSREIAVRVGRLLSGSGKALDTFLCPLHESGLVEGRRM